MIDIVGQAGERDIRPGGAHHKVGQCGQIRLLGIAHLVQTHAVRHPIVLATLTHIRQLGHRPLVGGSRLRLRRRGAGVGEEPQPFAGQARTKLVRGRNDYGVHGQGLQVVKLQLRLIRRHVVEAHRLRRICCRPMDNLATQLVLVEAVERGYVHNVARYPIRQLFRR